MNIEIYSQSASDIGPEDKSFLVTLYSEYDQCDSPNPQIQI